MITFNQWRSLKKRVRKKYILKQGYYLSPKEWKMFLKDIKKDLDKPSHFKHMFESSFWEV